jgi:DNA-binding MarR family transcriptional regulator
MLAKASMEGDPLTTEDLRRYLNLSSQTAHNTVTYFVEHGFITRETATFDGRAKHLQLTNAGRSIADLLIGEPDEKTTIAERSVA